MISGINNSRRWNRSPGSDVNEEPSTWSRAVSKPETVAGFQCHHRAEDRISINMIPST